MLSRVADSCFWLSRYIERAESSSRILDVNMQLVLDFEALCRQKNIRVLDRVVLDADGGQSPGTRLFPNLFGMTAIFRVTR